MIQSSLEPSPKSDYHGEIEKEESMRDRWSSRLSFILAAIGSAIGIGNFWRFPYLLYKHGGGVFLIPYGLALFAVGIPMLQLEITLGQLTQQGSVNALAAISPMMSGVGAASAFAGFIVVSYYNMIISWILIYLIQSFRSDLPWEGVANCLFKGRAVPNAEYYLYHELLGVWKKEEINGEIICRFREGNESDGMQWYTFAAMIGTWTVVYFCLFKGADHTSKIVYITVLLPVFILFVLFFRAITLDGASMGIEAYIVNWEFSRLSRADIWVDAVSQIFYSIGVASGIMIPFGSYNDRRKPLVADTFIIAICNSLFSFISGFVVMSTLGFYAHTQGTTIENLPSANLASIGLVFITYPTALEQLKGTNFWCILLFLNLFMLGIDSAFSYVEGIQACVEDTFLGKKFPRHVLLLFTISPCLLLGLFYCQDTGFYWFDIVDHNVQYIMLLVGGLQCFAIGWMKGTQEVEDCLSKLSSYYYTLGYTFGSILFIILTVGFANLFRTEAELNQVGNGRVSYELFIGGFSLIIICCIFWYRSYRASRLNWKEWCSAVVYTGPITTVEYWMTISKYRDPQTNEWISLGNGTTFKDLWIRFYGKFWIIMMKYILPVGILLLLVVGLRADILHPYGDMITRYQILGWTVFGIGLLLVLVPLFTRNMRPDFDIFSEDVHGQKMESHDSIIEEKQPSHRAF